MVRIEYNTIESLSNIEELITNVFHVGCSIEELYLSNIIFLTTIDNNDLDDEKAKLIAAALSSHPNLFVFDISIVILDSVTYRS